VASVAIVVPCYNEGRRLPLPQFATALREFRDVRFIFVNDGSTDDTASRLGGLREQAPDRVDVLHRTSNGGKGEAVRAGVLYAIKNAPQYVGYWDADLATPLDAIGRFRALLDERPDLEMVFGARVQLLGRMVQRRAARHYLGRVFATVVSVLLQLKIYDTQCGAKLFRVTPALGELFREPFVTRWAFDVEIVARLIRARQGSARPHAHEVIYEYPLETWVDVPGSKVSLLDMVRACGGLVRIYGRYLASRRPVEPPT
jgi:dolichyl-phosphate beta-glucosyltransferase